MKICSLCKKEKPLDEFTQNKGKPGSWCKLCYNGYKKDKGWNSYSKRADYFATYQRKLRKTEKSKIKERSYRKTYAATFAGMVTNLLAAAKDRAKKTNKEIDLDRAWVEAHLAEMKCEATGVDLILEQQENVQHTPFRPSIDRIDNAKGYTKDNCRVVCVIYNKAKSDYNDADVRKMAEGLIQKNG